MNIACVSRIIKKYKRKVKKKAKRISELTYLNNCLTVQSKSVNICIGKTTKMTVEFIF